MGRLFPTLVVLAVVGASAVALDRALAERVEPTPILRSTADRLFSPVCECPRDHARIAFRLRDPGSVTVTVRRAGGGAVGTLVSKRSYPAGWVLLAWNGIQPNGIAVDSGFYRAVVHLGRSRRTIELPNTIRVDTESPGIVGVEPKPLLLSPDGDGRGDTLTVRYRLREPGRGILYVDDRERATGSAGVTGSLRWNGRGAAAPLAPGPHALSFAAEDAAGNRSRPEPIATLTVRYVTLARRLVSVGPRERFYLLVSSDAKVLDWRFAGRTGRVRPGTIVLRAPRKTGRYRLYVTDGRHADAATVKVERIG